MGRPRKPAAIHKLQNTFRADRHGAKAVERPAVEPPKCPSWLSKEAKAEWARTAPQLATLGLLTPLDVALFCVWCVSWAGWRNALELVARDGMTTTTGEGGAKVHPAVKIADSYAKTLLSVATQFGLTPLARERLKVAPPASDAPPDPFEELLDKARFFNHHN